MNHRYVSTALCLGLVAVNPAAVTAQYQSYGYSFDNPVTAQLNTDFTTGMGSRLIYRMILKKHGYKDPELGAMSTEKMYALIQSGDYGDQSGRRSDQNADRADQPVILTPQAVARSAVPDQPASRFKPAPRRLLLPEMVKSLTDNEEYQGALLEVFEEGIKGFETEAREHGLIHDVAGAIGFFIGCAYTVCRNGEISSTDGLVLLARALQLQFNTEEFRRIPDGDKQKFYELMVALGTYLVASHRLAEEQKDAEFGATIRGTAEGALKGFLKMDPAKFRITANGLESTGNAAGDTTVARRGDEQPELDHTLSIRDLSVATPAGWQRSESDGLLILERTEDLGLDQKNLFRLVFAPPVRAAATPLATFQSIWDQFAGQAFEAPIRPLPLRVRLKSGATLLYDGAEMRLKQTDARMLGFVYVVIRGGTAVPVIGVFSGWEQNLDRVLREAFDSLRLAGASGTEAPLFHRQELSGRWRASSSSLASWVDAAGNYRGDATIATGETLTLNADGTYRSQFASLGSSGSQRSDTSGPYTVEDDTLILKDAGGKETRYRITGAGRSADDKARFLLLGVTRGDVPGLSAGSGMPRAGDAYVAVND